MTKYRSLQKYSRAQICLYSFRFIGQQRTCRQLSLQFAMRQCYRPICKHTHTRLHSFRFVRMPLILDFCRMKMLQSRIMHIYIVNNLIFISLKFIHLLCGFFRRAFLGLLSPRSNAINNHLLTQTNTLCVQIFSTSFISIHLFFILF